MLPIKANYKEWRTALLIAVRIERRVGLSPKSSDTRKRLAYELRLRRKYFSELGER